MGDWKARTRLALGDGAVELLAGRRVAVLGLGGVGGSAAEALCRAGVGHLLLIDGDRVDETNLNRQLIATRETIGMRKVAAAELRLHAIAPETDITPADEFFLPENSDFLWSWGPDMVIDACDTVTAKLALAVQARERNIPLLCCLGTGNRLHPECLRLGDIGETAGCGCPLARVMRRELRRRGIERLTVLYSVEQPTKAVADSDAGRHPPGSVSFVPSAAGYILAGECVRELISSKG